jgi:hypothetical protein
MDKQSLLNKRRDLEVQAIKLAGALECLNMLLNEMEQKEQKVND